MSERYEIHEQIGRGGLGIVYRARDTHLGRDVALKRVVIDSGEPLEKLTADLVEEAKTLSALKHPNIVTVHDVGQDEDGPFIVMELIEGETLNALIARGVMTIADFERFAAQCLEGMVAAQSVDLLHLDLKPPNFMIVFLPTGKFQVKILDFGLAMFSRKPTVQPVGHDDSILGSVYFLAPEQYERLSVDRRTDLYSLGAIFYYSLTGTLPFQGDNAEEIMNAHLEHRFTPLKEIRPELPDSVCDLVEHLMARRPEERPASAQAALDAWNLESVIDHEQLRDAASNDPVLATELLAGFTEETGALIEQLNGELESRQADLAEETARTIRGTAATLGYAEIISIAREIEEAARTDTALGRLISDRFPPALARLETALDNLNWPA